jgi:hypothetical protein
VKWEVEILKYFEEKIEGRMLMELWLEVLYRNCALGAAVVSTEFLARLP